MLREPSSLYGTSSVIVIGAGIAGSWQALLFAHAGYDVTLLDRDSAEMTEATSHWAGGMLAPWCEGESSEPLITRLGVRSLDLWRQHLPETPFNGSLVVANSRDRPDFERFAKRTTGHERLDAGGVMSLEPSLDGRFREGLFFAGEGHVEPRVVLPQLHARFVANGGIVRFQSECDPEQLAKETDSIVIDCGALQPVKNPPTYAALRVRWPSLKRRKYSCRARYACCTPAGQSTSFRAMTIAS